MVAAVAGGGGILLYLVSWILIPPQREGEDLGTTRPSSVDTTRLTSEFTHLAQAMRKRNALQHGSRPHRDRPCLPQR